MILESAVLCLALNIYHEARGEMIPGQYAVAHVTMNRAGDQRHVCETVAAKHQFSWTTGQLRRTAKGYMLKPSAVPRDQDAWNLAKHIARYTLVNRDWLPDPTRGATHYHAKNVTPGWRTALKRVRVIGRHVFYRDA